MEPKEIVKSITMFNRMHRWQTRKIMESEGLFYGQLPILETVRTKGCCTQREIATALNVTPPSVATSVKRLVKKGYLAKKTDEKDQRSTLITITESGNLKTQACRKKFDEMDERIFDALSDQECEGLAHILDKLNASMRKENEND
ncbi:MarR family transcriptional regulator [uncultured Traorella sp.]|uniref:MarR family winged helix-turn-helix transcriptional regulator n=1 Tax=uncultured Traorella sp. TaxID=1929048 RepID=UPI0025E07391|nr:MarR family transcriptional regulator [uncultured Traorella sp.]